MDNKELLDLQEVESYRRKRNAIFRRKMIWVTRTIPYYLDPGLCKYNIYTMDIL